MPNTAIKIRGLTKSYNDVPALQGINIDISKGEFFGLLGPNGAGKTTTINILTGLVFKDKGTCLVFNQDIVADYRYTRSKIGIAAQELSVDWFFTIEKLLYFQAGYYGLSTKSAKNKVDELLNRLGLDKKRNSRLRQLSGGMKRRFQIAKALVHDPDILILDEPTSALGVHQASVVLKIIVNAAEAGLGVILITHNVHHAYPVGNRFTVLNRGTSLGTFDKADLPREKLLSMMAGGEELDQLEIELKEMNNKN